MLSGGPEPSGFLSISSCSLVFFSSSHKLLLDTICLLFTASSFSSFRKLALQEEKREVEMSSVGQMVQSEDQHTLLIHQVIKLINLSQFCSPEIKATSRSFMKLKEPP